MAETIYDEPSLMTQESAARRRRRTAFGQAELERANLGQQTSQRIRDVTKAYQQATPQQITSFTGRGLGRSGLFNKAMSDFVAGQQDRLGDITAGQTASEAQIQLKEQMAQQAFDDEMARIAGLRQQQILQDAQAIKQFAPMTGLFS